MTVVLLTIPLLALVIGIYLSPHNGKKEILRFDFVQFAYAFILMPLLFFWGKSFLFFVVKENLRLGLSIPQWFFIDSLYSLLYLYLYSFVVIHSLTKSFEIKKSKDPLYDLFEHSEYFHMWLSHAVTYSGGIILLLFLASINIFYPLPISGSIFQFLVLLTLSVPVGFAIYMVMVMYQGTKGRFMQLMKLMVGAATVVYVCEYFFLTPSFSIEYSVYWFSLFASVITSGCVAFAEYSQKASTTFEKIGKFLKLPSRGKKIRKKLFFR